jgi:hypothetical protein
LQAAWLLYLALAAGKKRYASQIYLMFTIKSAVRL